MYGIGENRDAYAAGRRACIAADHDPAKVANPYAPGTVAWRSFNLGWNSVLPDHKAA